MHFTLIVRSNHLQNTYSALQFAQALLGQHQLVGLFFLFDAAYLAQQHIDMPTDEPDLSTAWQAFSQATGVPLRICTTSALRRGLSQANLAAEFSCSSIGELVASCDQSDRVVCL